MITISEDIEVDSPADVVWSVVSDPKAVVSCINGAELGETFDDGTFDAKLTVRFGGLRVSFTTRVALALDEPARSGTMTASGKDGHGGTRAKTTANFTVKENSPSSSTVLMRGEVELSGKLKSLIEAGATTVVRRMVGEFTEAFAATCAERSGAQDH